MTSSFIRILEGDSASALEKEANMIINTEDKRGYNCVHTTLCITDRPPGFRLRTLVLLFNAR